MGERTCFSVPQHTNCLGTPGSGFKKDKEKIPAPPSPQPVLTAPSDLGTMSAAAGTLKPTWSQVAASIFKLGNMGQIHPTSLAAGACGQQARSETQPYNFQSFLSPFPEPFLDLTCPYRGMGIRLQAQFPQCLPEHHCKYHSADFSWLLCCQQVPQEREQRELPASPSPHAEVSVRRQVSPALHAYASPCTRARNGKGGCVGICRSSSLCSSVFFLI